MVMRPVKTPIDPVALTVEQAAPPEAEVPPRSSPGKDSEWQI
jgi:hypothetical protein